MSESTFFEQNDVTNNQLINGLSINTTQLK